MCVCEFNLIIVSFIYESIFYRRVVSSLVWPPHTHWGPFISSLWQPRRKSWPALYAEITSARPFPYPAVTASALLAFVRHGAARVRAKVASPAPSAKRKMAKCCATAALPMQMKGQLTQLSRPAWGVKCRCVPNTSGTIWRDRRLAPIRWWIRWGTSPSEGAQRTPRYSATTVPMKGCMCAVTVCWTEVMFSTK